jgi:CHAT domain-containing protein
LDECSSAFRSRDFARAVATAEAAADVAREQFGTAGAEFREAVHCLAAACVEGGKVVVARALLEWIVRAWPDVKMPGVWAEIAYCMMKENEREEGLMLLDALLLTLPDSRPAMLVETLNAIGNAAMDSGHPENALALYQKVEELRRELDEPYKTAEGLYNLGSCYVALGDYVRAVAPLTEALEIFRPVLGDSHPLIAETGIRLGISFHHLGEFQKATAAYRLVVRCYKLNDPDADLSLVAEQLRLAEMQLPPGGMLRPELPERKSPFVALTKGLDFVTAARFDDIVRRFYSRDYSGCARVALGSMPKLARYNIIQVLLCSLERLGLEDLVQVVGDWAVSISVGSPYQNLLKFLEGQQSEAEMRWLIANHISQETLDFAVASKLINARRFSDAEPLLSRIIETRPTSLEGVSSLVEKYLSGVAPGPLPETERAALREAVLQLQRERLLDERRMLVQGLTEQGEFDRALAAQRELLSRSKETADSNPIPYAQDLNNLAHILFKCGRYEESLPFYEQCVATLKEVPDCIEAGDAANNLGNTYFELNRFDDAIKCHELATELRLKTYGDHPRVILGLLDLASVHRESDNGALYDVYNRALRCVVQGLGDRFPRLVHRLKATVERSLSAADFDSAHKAIRRIMGTWEAIIEATQNPTDMLEAGIVHEDEGRRESAISFIRSAAERAAEYGLVNIETAAIIEFGKIALRAEDTEAAFGLATQALMRTTQAGDDLDLRGRALLLKARCHIERGDEAEEALPLLAEVVELGEATEAEARVAAHTLSAHIWMASGRRQQAIESLEAAMRETEALPASEALTALYAIASQLKSCNANERVSECLERARALTSAASEFPHTEQALYLSMECARAIATSDYTGAYGLCREALQHLSHAGHADPKVRAELLEDYGAITFLGQRDFKLAAEAYELAVNEYEKGGGFKYSKAKARVTLAKTLLASEDLSRASEAIREAFGEVQDVVGNNHWLFADALGTAGRINLRIGAYQTAEYQLTDAKRVFTELFGEDDVNVVQLNRELSLLHLVNGRWAEALSEARQSRLALEALYPQAHESSLFCQKIEARANYALGNVDLALRGLIDAVSGETLLYLQVAQATNNAERMRMANSVSRVSDELLTMAWNSGRFESPDWVEPLFLATARSKRLTTEMFSKQEDALRKTPDTTLQKKLAELRELRSLHAQTALMDPTRPLTTQEQANLARLQKAIDRMEFELSLVVPQLINSQDLSRVTIENLGSQLVPGQAMVAYVKFDEVSPTGPQGNPLGLFKKSQYLAFVLTNRGRGGNVSVRVISLGTGEQIDELVDEYLLSLKAGGGASAGAARLLSERLVHPLLSELDGVKGIYVVPDGSLYSLPFEAVPIENNILIADLFEVTYLEAARDLLRAHEKGGRQSESAVFAAPDYGLASTSGEQSKLSDHESAHFFAPLVGAAEEGRLVAELLGTEAITGPDATETRLKSVSSPRVLHLATHGYFFPARREAAPVYESVEFVNVPGDGAYLVGAVPKFVKSDHAPFHQSRIQDPMLRSGMALAGANTWINRGGSRLETEDGLLSSADITGLDLRNTEIVVLSACETGLGVVDDAEGVLGVRRAFVIAGTNSLVCSLWKVPDEETKRLMVSFYSFIKEGSRPSAALKLAKEELRGAGFSTLAWAGFIHIGRF